MASLLALGGGANEGLDNYLNRLMAEERLKQMAAAEAEQSRHNQATESNQRDQLTSIAADRVAKERETAQNHREQADARDDTNVTRQIQLRPIDQPEGARSFASPEEKALETKHGIPDSLYGDYQPPNMGMSTETKEVGPTKGGMPWAGTQDQQQKVRTAAKEAKGTSVVQKTANGDLVRIYEDGTTEPVTDKESGNVLKGFTQPQAPTIIQTDSGFMRAPKSGGAATPVLDANGQPVQPKDPAQVVNRRDMAQAVGSHFADAQSMLDEAEKRGLLGPLAGRTFTEFMAGKVGTTGNKEDDDLLGDLRMSLSMISSGTASLHGRSGANYAIAEAIQKKMNEGYMSHALITGGLRELKNWVYTYATKKSAAPPQVGDPYQDYLNRKK